MKLLAVFAIVAVAFAQDDSTYTTKYDKIDLDAILKSDRLFNNYYKCLMDQGPCTPDGSTLKRILPEALQTNCAKCDKEQRTEAILAINYVINNRPDQWKNLQAKYDPDNVYTQKYHDEVENSKS